MAMHIIIQDKKWSTESRRNVVPVIKRSCRISNTVATHSVKHSKLSSPVSLELLPLSNFGGAVKKFLTFFGMLPIMFFFMRMVYKLHWCDWNIYLEYWIFIFHNCRPKLVSTSKKIKFTCYLKKLLQIK